MAQTPFSTLSPTYFGQLGSEVIDSVGTYRRFWLGQPGAMIQIPSPMHDYTVDWASGEVEHRLLSSGSAVTRRGTPKRRYTLAWPRLGGRDFQIVAGFYRRAFGGGPWCFVAPDDANRLSGNTSLCGGMNGDISGWTASGGGTISVSSSAVPAIYPSGVMQWSGAGNGSTLTPSPYGFVPDVTTSTNPGTAIPYLPAEPFSASIYAATASGTASVRLGVSGRTSTGGGGTTQSGTTIVLTTTPVRLTISLAAGVFGVNPYLMPQIECLTAAAPNMLVSAAQCEYESAPTPFVMGNHVPRVIIPAGISRAIDPRMFNGSGLVLAEV